MRRREDDPRPPASLARAPLFLGLCLVAALLGACANGEGSNVRVDPGAQPGGSSTEPGTNPPTTTDSGSSPDAGGNGDAAPEGGGADAGPAGPDAGAPPPVPGGPVPASAPKQLDVVRDQALDGEVVVDGPVVIHAGVHVTSPSGDLKIRARTIVVESGASIAVAPTGTSLEGAGAPGREVGGTNCEVTNAYVVAARLGGSGGGYATAGEGHSATYSAAVWEQSLHGPWYCHWETRTVSVAGGAPWGVTVDPWVRPGSPGGTGPAGATSSAGAGGKGGGVLQLFAGAVTVHGTLAADGQDGATAAPTGGAFATGSGGGSGGAILLLGREVVADGDLHARGGAGSAALNVGSDPTGQSNGGRGGGGFVKVLYGGAKPAVTVSGATLVMSVLSPDHFVSTTHQDPTRVYNDDFAGLELAWSRPFVGANGYYVRVTTSDGDVPSPTNGTFLGVERLSVPRSQLVEGLNLVRVVTVNTAGETGTLPGDFALRINTRPPAVTSSTHPDPMRWEARPDVLLSWTLPVDSGALAATHYVVDHYGDTRPGAADTALPASQKSLLQSGLAPGVWVVHVATRDQAGYFTRAAAHYRVNVGADPGIAAVLGTVKGPTGNAIPNAEVTIHRGLYAQRTDSAGAFNFQTLPAGTWEVTARGPSGSVTKTVAVAKDAFVSVDLSLP